MPTATSTSWIMAMNAASAIFGSKRMLMYAATTMKKMINALMASLVMDEPQVGPTVVMEILSAGTVVVVVGGVVVVVVAAPDFAVVVVAGLAVVVVELAGVCEPLGAWAAVSSSNAFWTFLLTCCWLAYESLFRSDCTFSVCLLPEPRS